jgi:L-fuconolactonase
MPTEPVIDTHLHLWDPGLIRYPWLDQNALLNRPYLLNDYRAATQSVPIESMVFVQCEADFAAFEAEAAWVADLARSEPRIKGLVAWAPLEKGGAVRADLERLRRHSILRGIRRIIQFEPDLDFCLRPAFIEGVRALKEFDLSFDICIDHRHMGNILKFVECIPEVPMVLDHIGKPAIKDGMMNPWASQIRELAHFPNVTCKVSGVATEADHKYWKPGEIEPYIDVAIDAFGFDRIMFGGDWPVAIQAIEYRHWIEILDKKMIGVGAIERRKFWRDNAARFYRV